MIKKTNIRKRLLIFGSLWLLLCTISLTLYFVSQARHALLESTVKRSQILAKNLAEQARSAIYSGNQEAVEAILRDLKTHPEVLDAKIEYGQSADKDVSSPPGQGKIFGGGSPSEPPGMIHINGIRAIQSSASVFTRLGPDMEADRMLSDKNESGRFEQNVLAVVRMSVEPIYEQVDRLALKAGLFLTIVLIVGLFLGWLLSGQMISPLRQLAAQVSSIAEESFAEAPSDASDLSSTYHDEIDIIRKSLTRMKDSLDQKTAALARLNFNFEDKVREQTADFEKRNNELGRILNLKNDLIMQLTHELNTPLDALINHLSYLSASTRGALNDKQADRLQRTLMLCQRLHRMMTVILEFAVRESGKIQLKRERVSVSDVASQVIFLLDALRQEKTIHCVVNESVLGKVAFADPDHVEQILLNLVSNAIKASNVNGTIRIEAIDCESHIEMRVIDGGPGIPHALRGKLFHENVIPKISDGHGVGLFISRCLVELQGGRIWFETGLKGSTLFFTLPKYPSVEEVGPEEAALDKQRGIYL
jgi:signal transduction histidine kinase